VRESGHSLVEKERPKRVSKKKENYEGSLRWTRKAVPKRHQGKTPSWLGGAKAYTARGKELPRVRKLSVPKKVEKEEG